MTCCKEFEHAVKDHNFVHYYNTTEEDPNHWWMRFYAGEGQSASEDDYYLIKYCPFCGAKL